MRLGPLPVSPYTRATFFSTVEKDPVNLLYAGALADLAHVVNLTRQILECDADWGVGDQLFCEPESPAVAHKQDFNLATSFVSAGFGGRYHTRIYQIFTAHPTVGRLTASPIHHETWEGCWGPWRLLPADAASSFDIARDWAVSRLTSMGAEAALLPMTRFAPVQQCNGKWIGTDGRFALVAEKGFLASRGLSADAEVLNW